MKNIKKKKTKAIFLVVKPEKTFIQVITINKDNSVDTKTLYDKPADTVIIYLDNNSEEKKSRIITIADSKFKSKIQEKFSQFVDDNESLIGRLGKRIISELDSTFE